MYGNMQLAHCEKAMQDYLHLSYSYKFKGISAQLVIGTYMTPDRSSFFC